MTHSSPDSAQANTDREIWRGPENGGYYADSIHVTEGGGIGIHVGGHVIVKPLRDWHALARTPVQAAGELVAWRWRPRGAVNWIYDPTAEWRSQQKGADIDIEPLYAAPPQPAPDLTDPIVVHANMLRGTIAKPTWEQIAHLYPEQFTEIAGAAEECATIAEGHVGARRRPISSDISEGYDEACLDIAKAIRDAAPAAPQTAWQPIETAPKDGTRILVGRENRFPKNTYVVRWFDGVWSIGPLGGEWTAYPTHWMPIPTLSRPMSNPTGNAGEGQ